MCLLGKPSLPPLVPMLPLSVLKIMEFGDEVQVTTNYSVSITQNMNIYEGRLNTKQFTAILGIGDKFPECCWTWTY